MFRFCIGTGWIIGIAGLILLAPIAGFTQSKPQPVAQKPPQVFRDAAETGRPVQDRRMRVLNDPGERRPAPNNGIASTAGRQLLAPENESASTAIRTPDSEVEIDLTQEEAAWLSEQPEIVLGAATELDPRGWTGIWT